MLIDEMRDSDLLEVETEAGFVKGEWRENGMVAGERQQSNITSN